MPRVAALLALAVVLAPPATAGRAPFMPACPSTVGDHTFAQALAHGKRAEDHFALTCVYEAPDGGGEEWEFSVYWITPDNTGHEFHGCGGRSAVPTRVFVSAIREAFTIENISSSSALTAASKKMLAKVEPYAKRCRKAARSASSAS